MASPQPARQLLSRLYKDLGELQDNPYPGVAVFTDDANLRNLCLVLTPPSGPWKSLALHFDVFLGDNWPKDPPLVKSSVTGIEHPNLFGSYICCDLLRPIEQLARGYTGGYTPALTLRGLFLQFLTFFSSTKIEQDYGYSIDIGDMTAVCYAWDEEIQQHLPPGNCSCHSGRLRSFGETQASLVEAWKNCTAQEVVVPTNSADSKHKSKYVPGEKHLHRLEYPNPRRTKTLAIISQWKCPTCLYGSPSRPHDATISSSLIDMSSPLLKSSSISLIESLNDDILGEVALHLSSEGVIAFSIAYPRFRDIVKFLHVLRRQELTCFYLRTSLSHSILGVGISVDTDTRTLSSDFDWLSMEAFDIFKVRHSIEKRPFGFFLPLAFNRPHFRKAEPEIWKRLSLIDLALCNAEAALSKRTRRPSTRRIAPPLKVHHTVDVLYRMMNNIVVSLMRSCDASMQPSNRYDGSRQLLHASEKAVVSYCHLFHLLIRLCEKRPAILQDATCAVQSFITKQERRLKTQTPDMGEFIVIVMLVLVLPPINKGAAVSWETLAGKFLEEAITRNVRWILKDSPELEVLEPGPSDYRLNKTFENSKTSLRLIMFQITFLNSFIRTYSPNMSQLDDNYGFAAKELPEKMVSEIKEIYQVDSWPRFFQRVRFVKGAGFTKAMFSDMLRNCVTLSASRRYHTVANNARMGQLRGMRIAAESMGTK